MHGIVYVPESEAPSDPLESDGASYIPTFALRLSTRNTGFGCWYSYGDSKGPTWLDEQFSLERKLADRRL